MRGQSRYPLYSQQNILLLEIRSVRLVVGDADADAVRSAAGKSHLCMVLALSAQLRTCTPQPGGSIIITSERELPTDRLVQLAKSSLASHSQSHYPSGSRPIPIPMPTVKQLLDNIHVTRALDIDSLDHMLNYSLPWELEKRRATVSSASTTSTASATSTSSTGNTEIRLLILDSITALLRGGETSYSSSAHGLAQRSKHLCAIADKLKSLAFEYNLAIVVINQVSDVFARQPSTTTQQQQQPLPPTLTQFPQSQNASSSYGYSTQFFTDPGPEPPMLYATQSRWFSGQSQGYLKEASLGIVWANAVNTRIMMSRTGRRRRVGRDSIAAVSRKRLKRLESREGVGVGGDVGLQEEGQETYDQRPAAEETLGDLGQEEDMVGIQIDESSPTLIRRFHVVFSPFAPPSTVDYIITPSGVHSLEGTRKVIDLTSIDRARKKREKMLAAIDDEEWSTGLVTTSDKGIEEVRHGDGDEDEAFDDLGQLPAEFWDGKLDDDDDHDDGDSKG